MCSRDFQSRGITNATSAIGNRDYGLIIREKVYHLGRRRGSRQGAYLGVERGLILEARGLQQSQVAAACHRMGAVLGLKFAEDIIQVLLNCAGRYDQGLGDLAVRSAPANQTQDL